MWYTHFRTSAAVIVMAAALLSGCAASPSENLENSLAGEIQRVAHGEHDPRIEMTYLASFDWDQLYVFGPYTSPDRIQEALGFAWPAVNEVNIGSRDDVCLLVFVKGARVVRYTTFPRSRGDFSEVAQLTPYTRNEAIFTVRTEQPGARLVVEPASTLTIEPLP